MGPTFAGEYPKDDHTNGHPSGYLRRTSSCSRTYARCGCSTGAERKSGDGEAIARQLGRQILLRASVTFAGEVCSTLRWREVDSNPRSPCGGWCLGLLRRSYGKFGRAN